MNIARNITSAELSDMIAAADRPLLVDFWADWCGPCKALAPALDEIAATFAGDADVVKIDIVAEPAAADQYGARSIPLLLTFAGGVERGRSMGVVTKTRLAAMIEDLL